ncbi:MAG: multicopper oxidase domain-containing protein, partial [Steroidobacteraceae bacterium]|nr:multicopper oxidase domain-containing protein [Steroidobacteraceae bacterium]
MRSRLSGTNAAEQLLLSRRQFVQGLAAGGAVLGLGLWPKQSWALRSPGQLEVLSGTQFDLTIGETLVNYTGKTRPAITVNGSVPAPILRWREGTRVQLRARNDLPPGSIHGDATSIHWHGILLPANMDGVPGFSFDGINRGESYLYEFDVRQSGTYWYHSHSGFQEQGGMYGPLIIDPIDPPPFSYDRDYVVFLSDWTDMDPARLFARLKKLSEYDNYYQRTVGDFFRDVRRDGLSATLSDREAWGR